MLIFLKRTASSGALALASIMLKHCTISYIVGSHAAFFAATQCFTPLVGRFGGTPIALGYAIIRVLFTAVMSGSFIAMPNLLVYHVPSLLGSMYLALQAPHRNHRLFPFHARCLVSLLVITCMVAFVSHEVGFRAFPYALLWVLPAISPWLKTQNLFVHALTSTLITHAVGSIFWLYTHPMTAEIWIGLLPVACAERLLFATGIVFASRLIEHFLSAWSLFIQRPTSALFYSRTLKL